MPMPSPLDTLSRRAHAAHRRRGLGGVVQRLALVLLPSPRLPLPLLDSGDADTQVARERARRALLEARRAMSGVIGNGQSISDETAIVPAVMPDFERLQGFLEESERDRAALREEVSGLRGMLARVGAQLDLLQQTIEAMPRAVAPVGTPSPEEIADQPAEPNRDADEVSSTEASAPGGGALPLVEAAPPGPSEVGAAEAALQPPAVATERAEAASAAAPAEAEETPAPTPAQDAGTSEPEIAELRERVLRALRERVFAAGTVGTRIEISPTLPDAEAASVLARMNEEALVEHAEEGPPAEEATSVRVTLRAPMRWEQFSALLEAALGRPLPAGSVGWSHGIVRVNAASESDATHRQPNEKPCA